MDVDQNAFQENSLELSDRLFRRFRMTDVQESKDLFRSHFESALNRQRLHLEPFMYRASSLSTLYIGMLLTMTPDIWHRNRIRNAHVFAVKERIVLLTEFERNFHPSHSESVVSKIDQSVKLYAFSTTQGVLPTFPQNLYNEWVTILAEHEYPRAHLDEAIKSVHCITWNKPLPNENYEAYDQHGQLQNYISSEKSPLKVESALIPHIINSNPTPWTHISLQKDRFLSFPIYQLRDARNADLHNYLASQIEYLKEITQVHSGLIPTDPTSLYRFIMAGTLHFEVGARVQIVPRFTLGSIEDITLMRKNLPGTFMSFNEPIVFKLYSYESEKIQWSRFYENFIPAEIQTEVSSYHVVLMHKGYITNTADRQPDVSIEPHSLTMERPSWFTVLYTSELERQTHKNIFSEHLHRFLTFFDPGLMEHHLLGQLATSEAPKRFAMTFGNGEMTGTKPYIFSGLTINPTTKLAVMVNVANPDAFGQEKIGLDTLLVENKVRRLLQVNNVKELVVCNVDLSPGERYEKRLYLTGWTSRDLFVPYTDESNRFKGRVFSRSRMVDSESDWHDAGKSKRLETIFITAPKEINFVADDAYSKFRENPTRFLLNARELARTSGLRTTTSDEAMAILDGMLSRKCTVNYPKTQADPMRDTAMFLRPKETRSRNNDMWFHVFADHFPALDVHGDQIRELTGRKVEQAVSYHSEHMSREGLQANRDAVQLTVMDPVLNRATRNGLIEEYRAIHCGPSTSRL